MRFSPGTSQDDIIAAEKFLKIDPLLTGHQIEAIPLFVMLSIHLLLALISGKRARK
jgi:hypothetical protein